MRHLLALTLLFASSSNLLANTDDPILDQAAFSPSYDLARAYLGIWLAPEGLSDTAQTVIGRSLKPRCTEMQNGSLGSRFV